MKQKYFLVVLDDSGNVVEIVTTRQFHAKLFTSKEEAVDFLKSNHNEFKEAGYKFKIAAINEQTLSLETEVVITNDSPFTNTTPFYEE